MDSYRGLFSDHAGGFDPIDLGDDAFDADDNEIAVQPPPSPVGQDERRMQVRAYNLWASLLGNRAFPSVDDMTLEAMPDLASFAVVLDCADGIEDPKVSYLGASLAEECGARQGIARLSDIPSRSLLSRITDHYMQILANEAPIGFEAEFVNQRDRTVVYRGILLPFSQDGTTIRHILGVINWKELADQATTDAILAEIDKALGATAAPAGRAAAAMPVRQRDNHEPAPLLAKKPRDNNPALDDWAAPPPLDVLDDPSVLDLASFGDLPFPDAPIPAPSFGVEEAMTLPHFGLAGHEDRAAPPQSGPAALGAWLEAARASAVAALGAENRSHTALYAAIGKAWDFALAARGAPAEFAELLSDAGLVAQERAPMTPVVKLVFGVDYDKTRLAEYATALACADRLGLDSGTLAAHLDATPGGLKGLVSEERRLRRVAAGKAGERVRHPGERMARRLRQIPQRSLESFAREGGEFAVLLARRLQDGTLALIGEADDRALVERVARKLL